MKELYTITVNKKDKVENKTTNSDGSITIKYEEKLTPVKVFLKSPSRRDKEEMDMIYTAELQKCVTRGISTVDMIRRALLDGGGSISKLDLEEMDFLLKTIQEKSNLYQKLLSDKAPKEEIAPVETELTQLLTRYNDIENSQVQLFSRSAESYAQKRTVIWCVLNLSHLISDDGKEYTQVFRGPTFDSKLNNYYDSCEEEDKYNFELAVFDRAYVMYHGYISGKLKDKADFEATEANLIEDQMVEKEVDKSEEAVEASGEEKTEVVKKVKKAKEE
jgi:hypothetical protein